jgi:GTP-binding protein
MSSFANISFFKSAAKSADLDFPSAGEVAFVGRSNAGKSSALNALVNRKRLAFTSRTPGRTQQINFFLLGDAKFLVDLPGYGYAKVAKSEHRRWGDFLSDYLASRIPLKGLVLIMDARRPFTELDTQLLDWFSPRGLPVHLLLTKSDKLNRDAQSRCLRDAQARLSAYGPSFSASLYSSPQAIGRDVLAGRIAVWLDLRKNTARSASLLAARTP